MELEHDFGPLTQLIGTWEGDKGVDRAPKPEDLETNPYTEVLRIYPVGPATNAGKEDLIAVGYEMTITRKSTGKVFHHQIGYWYWDKANSKISHSLLVPRAVGSILEGSTTLKPEGFTVSLSTSNPGTVGVTESKFMKENASTLGVKLQFTIDKDTITYTYATKVHIYDKDFNHTDANTLTRKK